MGHLETFLKNADSGIYHDARKQGVSPAGLIARHVQPEWPEVKTYYDRYLGRYKQEDDGSSRARQIMEFATEQAAFAKVLAAKQVSTHDTIEKAFFSSNNDSALFPVYLAQSIIAGQLAGSLVPFFVAMTERVNSGVVEKITMNETEANRQLSRTGEGADLPRTTLSRSDTSVALVKYGRLFEATYEVYRRQTLDMVGLFLQRMGIQFGIDQSDDLIEALIAGDGTASSAVTDTDAEVSGTLDYDELIRLSQAFGIGYGMNRAVINDTNMRTILNMSEFKDPMIQVRFQERGLNDQVPILGATFHRWTSTGSSSFSTDRILAVDSRFAIKQVQEGDFLEEADQIIGRQTRVVTMSIWTAFVKLQTGATQCLDITT